MASRTFIWIDCDPGHDDALALILCGHSPHLHLLGVSTTHGNQRIELTTLNALSVLHAAGLGHVPVVRGAARPLLRMPKACPEVHGESGLDGATLPPPTASALPGVAAVVMYERLAAHALETGTPATLVATGALTNVALMLSLFGEDARRVIAEVVIMGGATGRGNTGPLSEFNIQIDPEAAALVFASGLRLTMIPLDVTHTALATPEVLACVAAGGTQVSERGAYPESEVPSTAGGAAASPAAAAMTSAATPFRRALIGLLTFFAETYRTQFEMPHPPLHDPCAVFYITHRHLFTTRLCRVEVETASSWAAGACLVDLHGVLPPSLPRDRRSEWDSGEPNVNVALKMDVRAFWAAMLSAIETADAVSPMNSGARTEAEQGHE